MSTPDYDVIAAEVHRKAIKNLTDEMAITLVRTSGSPIVTESKDYSITICDAKGRIVCGSGIIALHFGAAAHAVRSTIAHSTSGSGYAGLPSYSTGSTSTRSALTRKFHIIQPVVVKKNIRSPG